MPLQRDHSRNSYPSPWREIHVGLNNKWDTSTYDVENGLIVLPRTTALLLRAATIRRGDA